MSKSSNCIVTIAPNKLQDENIVHKRIDKIFKNNIILENVSVIHNSKVLPLEIDILARSIQKFELKEFQNLTELLQEALKFKSDGFVTIEAIPMHQVWGNADLDIIDTIKFNSVNSQIKLKLNKETFHSSPNIFNSQKGIRIKKIMESKKGHGALNHVTYNYSITFSTVEEDISPEMHHLIKYIFGYSAVKIYTNSANSIPSLHDEKLKVENLTKLPLKLNVSCNPNFTNVDFHEQSQEIYEYLALLHINSQQLIEDIDDYISNYQIPEFMNNRKEGLTSEQELFKHTFAEIDYSTFDFLMKSHSFSISGYTANSHILVLNVSDKLILWECH